MDWISKEFLLAVCGSLLIALIAVSWVRPPLHGPPQQAAESADRAAQSNQDSERFDYWGIRSYVDTTASYCTSERPNATSEWRKKFICESKVTDVVIAGLTVFLMFFSGLLVWVGYRQEKTTRRQLRAFVYLDQGSLYNIASPINPIAIYKPTGAEILSPTEGPVAALTIKNSGSTPAFRVVHYAGIHVAEFPLKSELPPIYEGEKGPQFLDSAKWNQYKTRQHLSGFDRSRNSWIEERYRRDMGIRRNHLSGRLP